MNGFNWHCHINICTVPPRWLWVCRGAKINCLNIYLFILFISVPLQLNEDEINLLYVAVTRAKKRLQMSPTLCGILRKSSSFLYLLSTKSVDSLPPLINSSFSSSQGPSQSPRPPTTPSATSHALSLVLRGCRNVHQSVRWLLFFIC